MGVKLDFFCCVGAELQDFKFGQETNSRLYFYRAFESQTIDDMLEPGFFNEAQDLRVGDLILLYAPNQNRGYAFARVISTTDGIVSTQSIGLKAQDVAVDADELDNLTGENLQKIIESADAKITELNTNKADKTTDFQTPITSANKGATMAQITALDNDLQAQITSNDADILKNTQDITALKGAGGALNASNFNTATPTQETLTKYAVDQIWPGNTNWAWNAANPAASTFTSADGVSRTAAEIFNSTWVNNTYDDHRWQLTNTQNTTPKVFEWADVGRDIVSVATATTAGIVRVGSGSQMVVNPTTGDISLDGTKASGIRSTIGALASNQGSSNSGLVLGIDADGDVVPTESSSGGRNIGDIFWTTRTDSALNGAVEANGAQYNFADVNQGQNNVQALLVSGALPSVPIAEFDAKVASDGGCDSFGYGTNELIIYPVTFVFGSTSSILCYTNITNWHEVERDHNKLLNVKLYDKDTHEELVGWYVKYMPETDYYYVYNNSDEAMYGFEAVYPDGDGEPITLPTGGEFQPTTYFKVPKKLSNVQVERPMVQLFNSATDEAVATCASVLQDVANLKMGDYVIYWDSADSTDHSHAKPGVSTPTDHGWYRYYKSGWVEQGGRQNNTSAPSRSFDTVYLYIPMKDKNYSFSGCFDIDHADSNSHVVLGVRRCRYSENDTPEKAIVSTTYNIDDVSGATGHYYDWEVKGWAA